MAGLAVRVSESAGFCPGVERALQLTLDAVDEAPKAHQHPGSAHSQPKRHRRLAGKGGRGRVGAGGGSRGHGHPAVARGAEDRSGGAGGLDALNVVDATCPFVTSAQEKAARLMRRGLLRHHPWETGTILRCWLCARTRGRGRWWWSRRPTCRASAEHQDRRGGTDHPVKGATV